MATIREIIAGSGDVDGVGKGSLPPFIGERDGDVNGV
jgi:hypothetical protein